MFICSVKYTNIFHQFSPFPPSDLKITKHIVCIVYRIEDNYTDFLISPSPLKASDAYVVVIYLLLGSVHTNFTFIIIMYLNYFTFFKLSSNFKYSQFFIYFKTSNEMISSSYKKSQLLRLHLVKRLRYFVKFHDSILDFLDKKECLTRHLLHSHLWDYLHIYYFKLIHYHENMIECFQTFIHSHAILSIEAPPYSL